MKRLAIHSVPRSGSTWLGSIYDSHPKVIYKYQPLFSYRFKNRLSTNSSKKEIVHFFNEIAGAKDDFLDQVENKRQGLVPEFDKEEKAVLIAYKEVRYHHLLENLLHRDPGLKVIGLVRNPLSTIYSWWQAPKEFRAERGWKIDEEWRYAPKKNQQRPEEFNGYEKWKEVAWLFERLQDRYPKQFYLLCYDDLLNSTLSVVEELFSFVGLTICTQTQTFIQTSQVKNVDDAYSVYRTKRYDQAWKGKLPMEIVDIVTKDLRYTSLEKYLGC